ncbi:MAG: hypothetical protein VB055_01510 [Oscillospiraceae bacterium]|nr:hypothetical protein [Oscillospiraceae bacterium]
MLRISVLCNAGVLLEYAGQSLLIDGINQSFRGFYGLPDAEFDAILRGDGCYGPLQGVLFTHCHPDHYDAERVSLLRQARDHCFFFIPDEKTPSTGCIQCGSFSVYYYETPHMPQNFAQVRHFVLRVEVGVYRLYFAADAVLDAAMHRRLMGNRIFDCVFVNSVYLAVGETRDLLRELSPRRIVVYHLPADAADQTGIRRKTARTLQRYSTLLPPITVADHYPVTLLLDGENTQKGQAFPGQ